VNDTNAAAFRRVRVLVSGLVQGVFYRASCADEARAAGVSGWVRNRSDGRVEAVFEGPASAVEHMLAWARQGPPKAWVDTVEVRDEPAEGARGFTVVRGD
jgi:acylphosphatase